MRTDDAQLMQDEPDIVTIADLQRMAQEEEESYVEQARARYRSKLSEPKPPLTELEDIQNELQHMRTALFRVKAKALEGIPEDIMPILNMKLNGALPIEIASELNMPMHIIRRVLADDNVKGFLNSLREDALDVFKQLLGKGAMVLREALEDPDPKIRIAAFRELAKVNNLYAEPEDEGKGKTKSAEDVIKDIISLARESIAATKINSPQLEREPPMKLIEGN